MKNKKLLCGLIFLILLMLVLVLFFKGQKYVIELSEENVGYIEVWDANTGELRKYSNRDDILDIVSCLNGLVLTQGKKINHTQNGSLYRVVCFSTDENEGTIFGATIKDMEQ